MEKQYKIDLINSLYGIIEGPYYASEMFERHFKQKYPNVEFAVEQKKIHRMIEFPDKQPPYKYIFAGCVFLTLTIQNESFTAERDWGIEYLHDSKHPDYETDIWFYESEEHKSYSDKMSKKLIEDLNNKQ